jgi:hypothetical protein
MITTVILFDLLCNHLYSYLMLIFMLGLPFAIIQGKNLMNSINIEYNVKYINIIYIIMMMMMMIIIMMMSRKDWNNDDNDINICTIL